MKIKIVLVIMFGIFTCIINAQVKERKGVWDYPVKPGTEEWASFTTGKQMAEACQIPQNVLSSLNTSELAWICVNYPLFLNYVASNDERKGVKFIIENFNGLNELNKRENGVQELIKVYKDYPVITEVQQESSKDYYTPYRLPFLELILSDEVFIKQLNANDMVELKKIIKNKYEDKVDYPDVYSVDNIKKTFLLGVVVIEKNDMVIKTPKQRETIKQFIANYNNIKPDILTEVSKIISEL